MTWTIYCLTQYPDVLINLQKEIGSVLNGQPPNIESLSRLVYTEAVLKESLRLYPPVPNILRRCIYDNTIVADDGKEIFVPKGTEIFMNFYTIHR
jgi:cytochrome P450